MISPEYMKEVESNPPTRMSTWIGSSICHRKTLRQVVKERHNEQAIVWMRRDKQRRTNTGGQWVTLLEGAVRVLRPYTNG